MHQLANLSDRPAAVPLPWVKKIFQRMAAMYGAKYVQLWGGVPEEAMAELWSEELAGFTGDEISAGLAACRSRDWPPTLPEFLKMCRPWMNAEVAFHEAVAGMSARRGGDIGTWSHSAVYWAAVSVGAHDLLNCGYSVMKARWERALGEEIAKGTWHAVPAPAVALPAPGNTLADKKEAEQRMKQMKASGALDQSGLKPTRWMKKVQERIEKGESVSPAIAAMLQRAVEEGKRP